MSALWEAAAGPHKYGVTLRVPGQAAKAGLGVVSLRAPGTGFLETARGGCSVQADGNDLLVHVPMQIAEFFDPDTPYLLEIPELGATGTVESWPTPAATGPTLDDHMARLRPVSPLAPPVATSAPPATESPTPVTEEAKAAEAAEIPDDRPPIPVMAPEGAFSGKISSENRSAERTLLVLLIALLGVLLLLALLAWLLLPRFLTPTKLPPKLPPQPLPAHAGSVPVGSPALPTIAHPDATGKNAPLHADDAKTPDLGALTVPEVIRQAPNAAAVTREGADRLAHGRADDGILLLEDAAKRGDGSAMIDLAHLYDPARFKVGGPIPAPDMRESADYYRKAAQAGAPNVVPDRAGLKEYLQKLAASGNEPAATATLKDYWP